MNKKVFSILALAFVLCSCSNGQKKQQVESIDKGLQSLQASLCLEGTYQLQMYDKKNPINRNVQTSGYDVTFTDATFYSYEYDLPNQEEIEVKVQIKEGEIVTPSLNLLNEVVYSKNIFNPYTGEDYTLEDVTNPFKNIVTTDFLKENTTTYTLKNNQADKIVKVLTGQSLLVDQFKVFLSKNVINRLQFNTLEAEQVQDKMTIVYTYEYEFYLYNHGIAKPGFVVTPCQKTAEHTILKQAFDELSNGNFTVDIEKNVNDNLFKSKYYFTKDASYNDDVDNPHGSLLLNNKVYFYQTYKEDETDEGILKRDYDNVGYATSIMDTCFQFNDFAIELFQETEKNVFEAQLPAQMGIFFAIDLLEEYSANGIYTLTVILENNHIKEINYNYSLMVLGGSIRFIFSMIGTTIIPSNIYLANMLVQEPVIIPQVFLGNWEGTFNSIGGPSMKVSLTVTEKTIVLNNIQLSRIYYEKIGINYGIGGYTPEGHEYWFIYIENRDSLYMYDTNYGQAILKRSSE